nr:hypothetical protein CFP56_20534 [Quercus suber]
MNNTSFPPSSSHSDEDVHSPSPSADVGKKRTAERVHICEFPARIFGRWVEGAAVSVRCASNTSQVTLPTLSRPSASRARARILNRPPHGLQHAGHDDRGLGAGRRAMLIHPRGDQDAVPAAAVRAAVVVGAADVAGGVVADHVDAAQRIIQPRDAAAPAAVCGEEVFAVLAQAGLGEFERGLVGFADLRGDAGEGGGGAAGDGGPEALEGGAEAALAEARERVGAGEPEVRVRVVEGRRVVLEVAVVGEGGGVVLGALGAEDAVGGEQRVEDDGAVEAPVARVVVDEDGVDLEAGGGVGGVDGGWQGLGEGAVVVEEDFGEGPDVRVCGDDVARRHDVGEAVVLGRDPLAVVVVSTHDQDGLVFVLREIGKGSVGLDEHVHVQRDVEFLREMCHALLLRDPAAIGEEDEGDAFLLQVREGFLGAREGRRGAHEDAVDVKGEGEVGDGGGRDLRLGLEGSRVP